ncbi:hypothetical protein BJY00DRAFT_312940 [Aspergillus carlsbadensis]|nr:hypothetical protein BJY00DRAFT_312940 [Aspergillus carlsbadensis]
MLNKPCIHGRLSASTWTPWNSNSDTTISYNGCDTRPKSVIASTVDAYTATCDDRFNSNSRYQLEEDGFILSIANSTVQILGESERGALYGAFEYLSMLAQGNFSTVTYTSSPSAPLRWANEWDNMDGTIERSSSLRITWSAKILLVSRSTLVF